MPDVVNKVNQNDKQKIDMNINPLCALVTLAYKIGEDISQKILKKTVEMQVFMDQKTSLLNLRKTIKIDDKELSQKTLDKIEELREKGIEIPNTNPSDAREHIDIKTRELGSNIDREFRIIETLTKDGQLINNAAQQSIRENPAAQIVRNQRG